jgi:hypothetical protein
MDTPASSSRPAPPIEHVHDALAEVERALQQLAELALVAR